MDEKKKNKVTSEILENVVKESTNDKITIKELTLAMKTSGFGVIMLIFSLGIVIPVPPPAPSIIAIPLLFFAFQMAIGTDSVWVPKWLGNLSIKRNTLAIILEKSFPIIRKFEGITKVRFLFVTTSMGERVIGILSFLFALSILVPLPFTNLIPGIGIITMSFGLIGKDGVIVVIGACIGLIGIVLATSVLILGKEAISLLLSIFS